MPEGPGKYDELATIVRALANAKGVVVVVIGGDRGSGFSVQGERSILAGVLPGVLREVADEIERSEAKSRSRGGQS